MEGERKQVTVLFADLKGSMELLADRDPEEARKILDPVLEHMMEAVHRYEGTVNQVMGDGIMALFGAPLALEEHAVRACYAALAMQSTVRAYSEQLRRSHGVKIEIRVGLDSGEVVVRAIGGDLRMDYTAVGETAHLAARMEQLALPGTTRLTGNTLALAEGFVSVTPLGPMRIKGLNDPVEVYELVGARAARARFHVTASRGLTALAGRGPELAQMYSALDRAKAGQGQIVALVGEPGVGKSRLVWEFTHSERLHGWLVLEAGSLAYGKAAAYRPVIDLLKSYFHIEDRDDPRRVRDKITRKLSSAGEALTPHLAALLALLDVPANDQSWALLDPMQKRLRTLEACKRLVLREAQLRPMAVVFEDLHWFDSESLALLDALVESLPTARLLVLVTFRPEHQHRWGAKTYYSQSRIDPLTGGSVEELLRSLLGTDPSVQPLFGLLIARTEGNPLFLEETVRALAETGELHGEPRNYRLKAQINRVEVSPTVQAILAARIDRLPEEDKQLLQVAAVIGKDVPFSLLEAATGMPADAVRQHLAALQAAEFLYEKSLFPDLEYTFKHALTHEVAYGGVLQERRRILHIRIMEALERHYADRLVEQCERLGYHAYRAQAWEKALIYLRQSGDKASGRSANREAAAWFEQALEALAHCVEHTAATELGIDLRCQLRSALHPLGEFARILEVLREAQRLADLLGDRERLARVLGYLALTLAFTGAPADALAAGHRALEIAAGLGERGLAVATNCVVGMIYQNLGQYRRSMGFSNDTIETLRGEMARERHGMPVFPAVYARHVGVLALAPLGQFDDAIALADEGFRICEAVDHPLSQAYMYMAAGFLRTYRGDFSEAIHLLDRGRTLCETLGARLIFGWVASYLGSAYVGSGRAREGTAILEEGIETLTALRVMLRRSLVLTWLGAAYLAGGRLDDAERSAQSALDLARIENERGHEGEALRVQGDILRRRGGQAISLAAAHYRDAMAIAEELGMRPLIAHCRSGLGNLHAKTGQREEAREQLLSATTLYRDMDMTYWLDKAESALKELSGQ
jgi:class 3 adenylate cyclase/tetratricopeptide (TPR) repeat protein